MSRHKNNPLEFTYENDEGEEVTVIFPSHWAICDCCRGNGTRVNPNVDGHGISRDEFDEDPEFEEDYRSGVYDISCSECYGTGKVQVPDWEHADPKLVKEYESWCRDIAEMNAIYRAERAMGA